jgi:NAD-dependent DNA ligase
MVDRMVFAKIQEYLSYIDVNGDGNITKKEIRKAKKSGNVPLFWLENISKITNNKTTSTDKIIMGLGVEHVEDTDSDHTLCGQEDGVDKGSSQDEHYQNALSEAKFFCRRNIEKWFSEDINSDLSISETEEHLWKATADKNFIDGDLTEEEYSQKYGTSLDKTPDTLEGWIRNWKEYVIYDIAYKYKVKLSDEDLASLDEEIKLQLNRMLVKPGVGKNRSLYQRLNEDAYTKLMTEDQANSCCGGDITPPPMTPDNVGECCTVFESMEFGKRENTAEMIKNRLAWAMWKAPDNIAQNSNGEFCWEDVSSEDYQKYHQEFMELRNLKAQDFRNLLKDENKEKRVELEKKLSMSVQQICDYINIVQKVTGIENFDDDDWTVNYSQFMEIKLKINGTSDDDTILEGKTAKDVLPERKILYEYLKTHTDANGKPLLLENFQS